MATDDSKATSDHLRLWSDTPDKVDLLAFDAIAETLVDAVLDDSLDPVALGVSGAWGSGKTTVLNLIEQHLERQDEGGARVLPILTEAWRYDPSIGAKESLMAEVLGQLATQIDETKDTAGKAKELMRRLASRVDWAKAFKMAAKASLAMQIPSIDSIIDLVKPPGEKTDDPRPRTLDGFRSEFAELLASDGLKHIRRVVVLVDDLDRCLPPTVVDTLEAIRLFLSVPKMSFVIAADEERVAEAIKIHFAGGEQAKSDVEHPSRLYLHKIVQTTIAVPTLSRFDTQAYLVLLQVRSQLSEGDLAALIGQCSRLRSEGSTLDGLEAVGGVDLTEPLTFAARLTPLLYEKLHGNPRRIKRFLNDLHIRQNVASRRGIALDAEVVAKLMVLEVLVESGFQKVLGWMARGQLRDRMTALERAAGRAEEPDVPPKEASEMEAGEAPGEFTDELLRWARLPVPLGRKDLAPYLHLAASISGETIIDESLPEQLRDIAANLLSESRAEQRSVSDADLGGLGEGEATTLVQHLGRAARDQPTVQRQAVGAILRIIETQPGAIDEAATALRSIPPSEIEPAAVLLFPSPTEGPLLAVLQHWQEKTENCLTQRTLDQILKDVT